jgi:heat shock protein HtpX
MYSAIASNKRRTIFILMGFVAFVAALSWLLGYLYGGPSMYMVLAIGLIYALVAYFGSKRRP